MGCLLQPMSFAILKFRLFDIGSCTFTLKTQYIYQNSKLLAILQLWYIRFLPGQSGAEMECTVHVALPKPRINQFKPVIQSRQQEFKSLLSQKIYCCASRHLSKASPVNLTISFWGAMGDNDSAARGKKLLCVKSFHEINMLFLVKFLYLPTAK